MKKFLFSIVALATATTLSAHTFESGDNVAGVSLGFGDSVGLPVYFSYERGVYDISTVSKIGVGAVVGYGWENYKVVANGQSFDNRISNSMIGVRGAYHYTAVSNLDLFGGVTLGVEGVTTKTDAGKVSANEFVADLYIGARYYLSDNFGIAAEIGTGLSLLNVGVAYKF